MPARSPELRNKIAAVGGGVSAPVTDLAQLAELAARFGFLLLLGSIPVLRLMRDWATPAALAPQKHNKPKPLRNGPPLTQICANGWLTRQKSVVCTCRPAN
jgi:hypothetical protein